MEEEVLGWERLLEVLRVLRGWTREELAAASGVSSSTIAQQEQGMVIPSAGVREKLAESLGVAGRDQELQILGDLRARMLDPEGRYRIQGAAGAGAAAQQLMEVALRLGLDHLERIEPTDSPERTTQDAELGWPLLLTTLRTLRGWSQKELAAASGVASGMISKQERGRRRPSDRVREKIEEALRVRGRMWEIELFLGELRAAMLWPGRRSLAFGAARAGEETRQIMEAALRLGYEDLQEMGEEELGGIVGGPLDEEE